MLRISELQKLLVPLKCIEATCSGIHTSSSLNRVTSGKYRITPKRNRPLTYEMANPPHFIAHRKTWNSWNTANLEGGLRRSETAVEDMFIRRFMMGTFHGLILTEVIIKRQFNHIRVAAIMKRALNASKMYFLIGFSEEMISNWLQCPVTLEIQTVEDPKEVIFKYI